MSTMKKSIVLVSLVLAMSIVVGVCAQDTGVAEPAKSEASKPVTQGELAQMLVRVLGLYRYLPANPTDIECFAVLMVNEVSPVDGWKPGTEVNREDLARVVVLAMGEGKNVENPDDPASWVAYLQSLGVPIEAVGETVSELEPVPDFKSAEFATLSSDPLKRDTKLGEPDDKQLQTDLGPVGYPVTYGELLLVLKGVDPNDQKPTPVTPN